MKIALLGYGTVGRGVDSIVSSSTPVLEVKRILDLPQNCTEPRMTPNYDEILDDPEIGVVDECMGGIEPAHEFILRALRAGKHVVTSNKAVVAAYFDEFTAAAREAGVGFFCEAAVGGGIPWIANIAKVQRMDGVSSFKGILNGTTNYIIDRMQTEGLEFDDVLRQAQELGYAERDPSADIDGIDVANKTIITACVAFNVACVRDLPVMGIRTLTKADIAHFASRGFSVKLLGQGVRRGNSYAVCVEPTAVPVTSLEANVPGNFNLATVEGATVGELKFYGQGAGSLPTGNAMVQDLLTCAMGVFHTYDFSADLTYDPGLLRGNYLMRTTATVEGASKGEGDVWHLTGITPVEAAAALEAARATDPNALCVAWPKED